MALGRAAHEGGTLTAPNGQRGAILRRTKGRRAGVGAVYMSAPQSGSPMTYMVNGRQYLTVAIGMAGYGAELLTFSLGT